MRGVRSLSSGLFMGLIIAATVFGALILSVRGQPASISELPIPTVTLQIVFTSPTAMRSVTPPTTTSITPISTSTPTPTPTVCPIPLDWQRYSVGPFDTLILIAQRFNLTPEQLVRTNCLDQPSVTVGQTIYVPGFKPTPTSIRCFPPFNWASYIVQPGDTLSSIAARYGISVYTLMRANCLSTTFIYYGQRLYVPPIYPSVTFTPTPIIPTFTPTPDLVSPTPTETPTMIPTTPVITDTPTPTETPGPTDTPSPTVTPAPTDTSEPTATPTELPPATYTPEPPATETTTP
ncbi:putative autolysin SsaALP [Thermoflexales bacterium]|nr:putative autolysin SsaALP [Thermoflexales bacterium]